MMIEGKHVKTRKTIKLRMHKSGKGSVNYLVTIPRVLVESVLKWKPGEELSIDVKYDEKEPIVIIRRARNSCC